MLGCGVRCSAANVMTSLLAARVLKTGLVAWLSIRGQSTSRILEALTACQNSGHPRRCPRARASAPGELAARGYPRDLTHRLPANRSPQVAHNQAQLRSHLLQCSG